LAPRLGEAVDLQRLADDRRHREPRIERRIGVLEDDLHVAAQSPQRLAVEAGDIGALEPDLAGTGLDQPQDAAAGRRLAAARLAHQPERLAGGDVKAHAVDGMDALDLAREYPALHREVLAQVAHRQERIGAHSTHRTKCPGATSLSGGMA